MNENMNEGTTAPLPEPIQPSVPEAASAQNDSGAAYVPPANSGAYAYAPPATPEYPPTAPAYTPAPGYPAYAQTPPAPKASRRPATWIIVTASVAAGVLLLAITFGIGVAVGSHASRFERGAAGMMMQPPGNWNGERGLRDDSNGSQGGQGYNYHGYGGRGGQRSLPSPDATPQQ